MVQFIEDKILKGEKLSDSELYLVLSDDYIEVFAESMKSYDFAHVFIKFYLLSYKDDRERELIAELLNIGYSYSNIIGVLHRAGILGRFWYVSEKDFCDTQQVSKSIVTVLDTPREASKSYNLTDRKIKSSKFWDKIQNGIARKKYTRVSKSKNNKY